MHGEVGKIQDIYKHSAPGPHNETTILFSSFTGVIKEEEYDDDYSSEDDTDDEGGARRRQVVQLSHADGAVPQGQPILLQMEFLQQEGEGAAGGEGENGQVVRKVTRQATLQTTPDGQQIIILQGEEGEPTGSPSKKSPGGTPRARGRPPKPSVEMPLGDGKERT